MISAIITSAKSRCFQSLRRATYFAAGLLVTLSLVGGAGFSLFEPDASLWDGIYWTWVILPTVGFGDFYPVTEPGRVLYLFLIIGGKVAEFILAAALVVFLFKMDASDADESAELDDDIERIKDSLSSELTRLQKLTSTPRVLDALKADHAERKANNG